MKVKLECSGFEGYQTDVFHILKLFFEDIEMIPGDQDELFAFKLSIQVIADHDTSRNHISIRLINEESGIVQEKEHTAPMVLRSSTDRSKSLKRGILQGLLLLFSELTGIQQPWGTLTGIRPTKLMHQLLQSHGQDEAVQLLQDDYLVQSEKINLLLDIVKRQLKVIPDLYALKDEVSIYIGIPFCPTKCAYCTFPAYDIRASANNVDSFLFGLHEEIRQVGSWLNARGLKLTTIYWGGGTPTSITAEEMDALFQTMYTSFPSMETVRELTVEAGRPDTITPDKIHIMRKWNVDRISINPQSFTEATLEAIGRHHSVDLAVSTFKLSREMGMDNINMDLIIGLPGEGIKAFQHSLNEVGKLLPESLTVHTLSFKRASAMTKDKERYKVADREDIGEMVQMAEKWTQEHHYHPYYLYRQKNILGNLENVGYALEGRESLYNIVMMEERQTIIGLGCGAVSKICFSHAEVEGEDVAIRRIERFPNPKDPGTYNRSYQEYIDKKLKLLDEAYNKAF